MLLAAAFPNGKRRMMQRAIPIFVFAAVAVPIVSAEQHGKLVTVAEIIKDRSVKLFPHGQWNPWDNGLDTAAKQFVCVQSVFGDDQNIRVDITLNTTYMRDSGAGGIVMVDLNTRKSHRGLDNRSSVMPEQNITSSVNGKPVLGPDGKTPAFKSDGIALSHDGSYLYYQALAGATNYRIKTTLLCDGHASPDAVAHGVEKVATKFPSGVSRLLANGKVETLATGGNGQTRSPKPQPARSISRRPTSMVHRNTTRVRAPYQALCSL